MRFTIVAESMGDCAVLDPVIIQEIGKVLRTHGYKVSSVIPESVMGKKFRVILDMAASLTKEANRAGNEATTIEEKKQ